MKKDRNQLTCDRLNNMKGLTERAKLIIADTSFQVIDDLFGNLETAEEVNRYIEENYPEED